MELISLKKFTKEQKIELLKELGMDVDQRGIVTKDGVAVLDKYIAKPVQLGNMIIFPGSAVVLDDNALSIARYMDEYGEL